MIPFQHVVPWLIWALVVNIIQMVLTLQASLAQDSPSQMNQGISEDLFNELEEHSRIVDIAYCVGLAGTGIRKPFACLSRCDNFKDFELVTVCHRDAPKKNFIIADMIVLEHWSLFF